MYCLCFSSENIKFCLRTILLIYWQFLVHCNLFILFCSSDFLATIHSFNPQSRKWRFTVIKDIGLWLVEFSSSRISDAVRVHWCLLSRRWTCFLSNVTLGLPDRWLLFNSICCFLFSAFIIAIWKTLILDAIFRVE